MVTKTPPMIDMACPPDETPMILSPSDGPARAQGPRYPYGLSLCFNDDVLKKLKLDFTDVNVGETLHLFAFAKVTGKSMNEDADAGANQRIELQITHLSGEDEDEENAEAPKAPIAKRLYR